MCLSLYKKFHNFCSFSYFDLIVSMKAAAYHKDFWKKKRIWDFLLLDQLINQFTNVFYNVGSFLYADLNFSMKAAIYL